MYLTHHLFFKGGDRRCHTLCSLDLCRALIKIVFGRSISTDCHYEKCWAFLFKGRLFGCMLMLHLVPAWQRVTTCKVSCVWVGRCLAAKRSHTHTPCVCLLAGPSCFSNSFQWYHEQKAEAHVPAACRSTSVLPHTAGENPAATNRIEMSPPTFKKKNKAPYSAKQMSTAATCSPSRWVWDANVCPSRFWGSFFSPVAVVSPAPRPPDKSRMVSDPFGFVLVFLFLVCLFVFLEFSQALEVWTLWMQESVNPKLSSLRGKTAAPMKRSANLQGRKILWCLLNK